jgi:orotate phosphoribosyltransferase
MERERVLTILRDAGVLLEGHFLLTSGKHSDKYLQCAKILKYPNYTVEMAEHIAKAFENDNIDIVIGPAMGAVIISYEVARQLGALNMFAERENDKMALRRGFEIPEGARVLVVEDVVTTGGSVKEVISIVEEKGGIVAGVGVFVDRSNGKIDFGVKMASCISFEVEAHDKENCPLCKEGLDLVKPGSRKVK